MLRLETRARLKQLWEAIAYMMKANGNAERLINFAVQQRMMICGTLFPHKRTHKGTWRPPEWRTVN
jgi:hypothetical protein